MKIPGSRYSICYPPASCTLSPPGLTCFPPKTQALRWLTFWAQILASTLEKASWTTGFFLTQPGKKDDNSEQIWRMEMKYVFFFTRLLQVKWCQFFFSTLSQTRLCGGDIWRWWIDDPIRGRFVIEKKQRKAPTKHPKWDPWWSENQRSLYKWDPPHFFGGNQTSSKCNSGSFEGFSLINSAMKFGGLVSFLMSPWKIQEKNHPQTSRP